MSATPHPTPFDHLGEARIAAVVGRFYDLMEADPAYADLRALHADDLTATRHGLTRFLVGWTGGPRDWFAANKPRGGQCVMSLHGDIPIDTAQAHRWVDAMTRALAADPDIDPEFAKTLTAALNRVAQSLINRNTVAVRPGAGASHGAVKHPGPQLEISVKSELA